MKQPTYKETFFEVLTGGEDSWGALPGLAGTLAGLALLTSLFFSNTDRLMHWQPGDLVNGWVSMLYLWGCFWFIALDRATRRCLQETAPNLGPRYSTLRIVVPLSEELPAPTGDSTNGSNPV